MFAVLRFACRLCLALCCFAVSVGAVRAAPSPLAIEHGVLAVEIQHRPYRLQAMIVKESGRTGPLPVALITHGQSAEIQRRESLDPRSYTVIAREFARRGWLAVVVLRRGFGKSEGPTPYALRGCSNGNYAAVLNEQTDDIAAVFAALSRRGDADMDRVLGFGTSVGGMVMLNLAARAPAGLRAVVNMSGGVASRARDGSSRPASCRPEHLAPVVADYGRRGRVPTLWLYAENDSLFPPDYVRSLHGGYVAGGGASEFHMFEPLSKDGHGLYALADGMLRWLPALDGFLRAHGLPTYAPAPLEAALKAALTARAAGYFASLYRGRPAEKALALSPSGKQGFIAYGRATPDQAAQDSLAGCEKQGTERCRLVLQNFEAMTER